MLFLEQSVKEVILKINQETKNALHWPNYIALQWLLPILSLDLGGCDTLSEQLAHSAVDLHLKEISEFIHGSEMNKNPTLPCPLQINDKNSHGPFSLNCLSTVESAEPTPK